MNRAFVRAVPLLVALVTLATFARAAPLGARDPAFEQKIAQELDAIAPDATPIFQRATAAYDEGEYASSAALFKEVLDRAPGFDHAERRECGALAAGGHPEDGLPLCRAALSHRLSPANQAALASVLLETKGGPASLAAEAKRLAVAAVESAPNDPYYALTALRASLEDNDLPRAKLESARLEHLAPDDPMAGYMCAVTAAEAGDLDHATALLARARANGLPEKASATLAKAIDDAQAGPLWLRVVKGLGVAVAVWLGILVFLLGAGYTLSRATLRAIAAHPTAADVRPHERRLRKAYRAVLWGACAYYYASLPLLAIVVVAAVLGVIGAVLATGYIVPKLFFILILVAVGSLAAIAKSVFVRTRDEDPGSLLDLRANPRVREVLDEVAARIGTRPVDRVFVTPFTELAVFDRGSLGAQLRGGSDRCLILGAGVLEGLNLRAFKAVLAHEYGHFHNEDTAGGGFALAARRSLFAMATHLVLQRVASPFNPAWWFVRGFGRAFLGISQGASRLQEILADRWAAFAYGSAAFEEGLRHIIERTVRFEAHVDATLDEVVKTKGALANLYAFTPTASATPDSIESEIRKAFGKKPTPYDSHPCPEDRLIWVRALAFDGVDARPTDGDEAWSLFASRDALEAQMTGTVRDRLRARRGVAIPAA